MKYLDPDTARDDLVLGWDLQSRVSRDRIGLADRNQETGSRATTLESRLMDRPKSELKKAIRYTGDRHLLTFAPTGSGKGVSVIIPNLLHYEGPAIVVDPKGENFAVTARYRRQYMGQEIHLLDPFYAVDDAVLDSIGVERGRLNPLDLWQLSTTDATNDAQTIADILAGETVAFREPFWDIQGRKILAGLIAHEFDKSDRSGSIPSFTSVVDEMYHPNFEERLAIIYNTERPTGFVERSLIASYTSIRADETRAGMLSTAQSFLTIFVSSRIQDSLKSSTIDLKSLQGGLPATIYIVIPPDKLRSHARLLRLWIGVLMHTIMSRKLRPEPRTLFMLDECANVGYLKELETAVTLLRGYGLQVWMFFQDISQLLDLYGLSGRTIINNCGVVQTFGLSRVSEAAQIIEILGTYTAQELVHMDAQQQVLSLDNKIIPGELIRYYSDPAFAGRYDRNPLYRESSRVRTSFGDYWHLKRGSTRPEDRPETRVVDTQASPTTLFA